MTLHEKPQATLKNNMGDGWTVAKNERGRTVYTRGEFTVRATGAKFGAAWCVHRGEDRRYAVSLADARGVVERWEAGSTALEIQARWAAAGRPRGTPGRTRSCERGANTREDDDE